MRKQFAYCIGAITVLLNVSCARAPRPEEPALRLLSARDRAEPGTEFAIGVRIGVPDGWHTYWRNPGDVGEPARFEWETPPGVTIEPMPWPAPEIIVYDGLVSYGYKNEAILPFRLSVAADAKPVERIACRARWMICLDVCLPVEGEAELLFPAAENEWASARQDALLLESVLRQLPYEDERWQFEAVKRDGAVRVQAVPPADMPPNWQEQAVFLPSTPGLFGYRGADGWRQTSDGLAVYKDVPLLPGVTPAIDSLDGLLIFRGPSARALLVQAAFVTSPTQNVRPIPP